MKQLLLITYLSLFTSIAMGQTEEHYLVFFFNRVYQTHNFQHGTADHVWIVPFDSCGNNNFEKDMKPLFVDSFHLYCLNDPDIDNESIVEFPIAKYSKEDPIAWRLYKNRKMIQTKTIKKYTRPKSKDVLKIFCVPIIAKCNTRKIGFYKTSIVTIEGEPVIWTDFWKEQNNETKRSALRHDFSNFDFLVTLSKKSNL
ncbi:MAG: hypothetical protein IK005_03165 [Paludibacteraceae bacterium]|nr:hypothetical protein [Paludibacteraceae bacterium]